MNTLLTIIHVIMLTLVPGWTGEEIEHKREW